jgi:hypothetical protein
VHTCTIDPAVEISPQFSSGDNVLYPEQELYTLEHPSKALLDIFNYAHSDDATFSEHSYLLSPEDLDLAG